MKLHQIIFYLETENFTEKLKDLYDRLQYEEQDSCFEHTLSSKRLINFKKSLKNKKDRQKSLIEVLNGHLAEKNMSQQQLANRSYLTKAYISNVFHDHINPTKIKLIQIALALELSLIQTAELLKTKGFVLNASKVDSVIMACIENEEYDISDVHDLVEEYANEQFLQ